MIPLIERHIARIEKAMNGKRPISIQWFKKDFEAMVEYIRELQTECREIKAKYLAPQQKVIGDLGEEEMSVCGAVGCDYGGPHVCGHGSLHRLCNQCKKEK